MARKSSKMMHLLQAYDTEYVARVGRLNSPRWSAENSIEHKKSREVYVKCHKAIYKRCYPRGKVFDRLINLALGLA